MTNIARALAGFMLVTWASTGYPDTTTPLAPGVDQIEMTLPGPVAVHMVRVNRSEYRYDLRMGFPMGPPGGNTPSRPGRKDRATVSEIADLYDTPEAPVIAAINAGFFSENSILGVLADGTNLVQATRPGESYSRWPVFGWTTGNVPLADTGLAFPNGSARFDDGARLQIDSLNRVRPEDGLVCYTPGWGSLRSPSTETTAAGVEVIVTGVTYPLRPSKWIAGRISAIRTGDESLNNTIPPDGFVLSARGTRADELLSNARAGEWVHVRFPVELREWNNAELMATGAGWLVRGGKVHAEDRPLYSRTLPNRHPRSVIAWSREFLHLIVIDGRQSQHSVGMSFDELAQFLLTLGVDEAVNMDGGGSSSLVVMGRVVNAPSDTSRPDGTGGVERPVANALLLVDASQSPRDDFSDEFRQSGRQSSWEDKYTPNLVKPFAKKAPGGDGYVLEVSDPAGGFDTCRAGSLLDTDMDVSAWLYCEHRPGLGTNEFERIGIFARDSGHGAFDMPPGVTSKLDVGNCYLLTWDSNTGRVHAGKVVEGVMTDFQKTPVQHPRSGWRKFRIRAEGARMRYWLDDKLLADVEDASHTHGFSGIGYREYFTDNQNIRGTRAENFTCDIAPFNKAY